MTIAGGQKKLMMVRRIITTPFRAICKAKDFYIRSITDCANHTTYGRAAPMTTYQLQPLSRSSSSSSSFGSNVDDDLRELIRANSTTRMGADDLNITRADLELYIKMMKQSSSSSMGSRKLVPRSVSVGMGRIDEDGPVSSFPDASDHLLVQQGRGSSRKVTDDHHLMFPRSKSHAVTSGTKINRFS